MISMNTKLFRLGVPNYLLYKITQVFKSASYIVRLDRSRRVRNWEELGITIKRFLDDRTTNWSFAKLKL